MLRAVFTFAFTLLAAAIPASWNLAAAQQTAAADPPKAASTSDSTPAAGPAGPATSASGASPNQPAAPLAADPSDATADRTRLNLLGQVNSASGESRRNENVRLALIDNNVLSELNTRMGTTATIVKDFKVDQDYWATEFGGRPKPALHLPPVRANQVHGNIFWSHDNSIFRARKFFHVGEVLPARRNNYGFGLSLPLWKGAAWTVNGGEGKDRGQENDTVQVPTAEERTPLTNDPRIRPVVERILATYPDELPNLGGRTLNTNAPPEHQQRSGQRDARSKPRQQRPAHAPLQLCLAGRQGLSGRPRASPRYDHPQPPSSHHLEPQLEAEHDFGFHYRFRSGRFAACSG